jgi:hypothetical protein
MQNLYKIVDIDRYCILFSFGVHECQLLCEVEDEGESSDENEEEEEMEEDLVV